MQKAVFEKNMKWGLKGGGISIDADSGPHRYVLWCWGSICHQPFTFFKLTVAILCYVHFFFSQKEPRGYAKVIGTKYYKHLVMIWYKKWDFSVVECCCFHLSNVFGFRLWNKF